MLTKEETDFIAWWEKNRERETKLSYQIIFGLPWGLVFALPILIAVIFNDWYKNMIPISTSQLVIIGITVLAIALFYAVFRKKVKCELYDQQYKELKLKEKKSGAAIL